MLTLDAKSFNITGAIENAKEVIREAGEVLAKAVQARIRAGYDADGKPLPQPEDGGDPFVRSGKFVKSIKFRGKRGREGGLVGPGGARNRRGEALAKRGGTSMRGTGAAARAARTTDPAPTAPAMAASSRASA